MDKAVADTHCLLGSRLRDPDSGRQGRIVGIDQSRETPALLVNWGQSGVERVSLSTAELSDLVTASLAHERNTQGSVRESGSPRAEEGSRADAKSAVSERQSSRSTAQAAERSRSDRPAGRTRNGDAAPNASSSTAPDSTNYRPLATGSDGRR